MSVQHRQLTPRSNKIKDTEIPKYLGKLKRFLGHEALAKAQADLDKDLLHHGRSYCTWSEYLKPWLFAFRAYDRITNNGVHMPRTWPTGIRELAGEAWMIASLYRSMPEEVREKYRKDLLSNQHNDFMVEIFTGWYYHLKGYHVEWYPLGHIKVPEFRVQGGGLDFDVECRRFSWDVSEDVKMPALADTCDSIYKALESHSVWGEVKVEFPDNFVLEPGCTRKWSRALTHALAANQTTLQLDPGIQLTLDLKPSPSQTFTPEELTVMAQPKYSGERNYSQSKSNEGFDPIVIRCYGPRKTSEELRDFIYKTLKEKVTTQLGSDRAGVLIVRFAGIYDPQLFNESEGLKQALGKLFTQLHLAAVVLQCERVAEADRGSMRCALI